MRILIICTHNAARSVMLEGYLKQLKPIWKIYSAGTQPSDKVNPLAVKVMAEDSINISAHKPAHVSNFLNQSFDYVITVCDEANNECPTFSGDIKNILYIPFQDPSKISGNEEKKLEIFRKIRDQIKEFAYSFIKKSSSRTFNI
ncbi:MAG: arsenate reductase ArsC [Candidatus Babeliales bacterium]